MSTNPIDFPGRFTGHAPVPLHTVPAGRRYEATSDNRIAVESLLDATSLPAPVIVPGPDRVHVTVADIDDLAEWVLARGGRVLVSPQFEGVRTYVLITYTDQRADGSRVEVRVSCAVPEGAAVMPEISAAVAR
ncbi:hypothetical protein ACIGW8_22345 [Streptomyces sioyaensis]|uniref:hypothetical protein n=1 Tax=Streptomyces sioyaensis TaxID=67364 RepID=UPI0037D6A3D3